MGGEWYGYWGGGVKSAAAAKKGRGRPPAGCINTVLHLLDFHHFQFGIRVPNDREQLSSPVNGFASSSSPSSPPQPQELAPSKGTEAPRNSLELEQPPFPITHHYDTEYENFNIPMGIQVRTRLDQRPHKSGSVHEVDSSPSGGNRTPTLVARLMGLDILPTSCSSSSPRLSSTSETMPPYSERKPNCPQNRIRTLKMQQGRRSCGSDTEAMNCGGTRSLPETTADHHRLSLQIINRENSNSSDEFDLSRFRALLRRKEAKIRELEENRSPSYSARQFAKLSVENAGRKVGVDITNTVKSRDREILVDHIKSKQESCFQSSSPKILKPNSNHKSRSFVVDVPKLQTLEEEEPQAKQVKCSRGCNKPLIVVGEKFDSRLKKPARTLSHAVRNQQEETSLFAAPPQAKSGSNITEKKCHRKSRPLPAKKDPSPPATKIPPKQQVHDSTRTTRQSSSLLPSLESSDRSTPREARHRLMNHDGGDWSEESLTPYISRVLERCCSPEQSGCISSSIIFKQFSTSHALDPSMFRLLELETNLTDLMNGQLHYRCNRKLVFDLLDQILTDIRSEPPRRNISSQSDQEITARMCSTIRSFPSADCQYLEDIDNLIEGDMEKSKGPQEEGSGLALEIEEDIMDKLIRETAMACRVTFT